MLQRCMSESPEWRGKSYSLSQRSATDSIPKLWLKASIILWFAPKQLPERVIRVAWKELLHVPTAR